MATIESYETKAGKRYQVRYRTPDHRQTKRRGFKTKRDATDFANTVEVSKLTGEFVEAAAGRATIGELGTSWRTRQTHLAASSARTGEVAWRVHVEPKWSAVKVGDIRHSDVQQWVSDMTSAGSGPVTVIRAYGVLKSILDDAVRNRRIASSPADKVKLPRKVKSPHTYLSHGQVRALATEAGIMGVIVYVLAYTGLRWGELAALRARDIDPVRRRLSIERNAVNVGGHVIVGTPKSRKTRSVPVPRFIVDLLVERTAGHGPDELVFPNRDGGYAKSPGARTWFSHAVDRCIASAEAARADERAATGSATTPVFPRITPHSLRHTAASLAVKSGANVKAVQRMLGHASAAMTLDTYADLFDDDLDDVGDALDRAAAALDCAQNVPTNDKTALSD